MTTATRPANRLAELNAILDKMPMAEAARQYPEMWRERAALIRKQQEEERLHAADIAERRKTNIAAAFTPNIEAFRKQAHDIGRSFEVDVAALEKQLGTIKQLQADHNQLWRDGRTAGVEVPSLSELCGIGEYRLQRVQAAIHFLELGDA